jgi:hypothetical protein
MDAIMDSRLKRYSSYQNISSFATEFTQCSAIKFAKQLNILTQPVTTPQELQEARTVYLESRAQILYDFDDRRDSLVVSHDNLMDPLQSANGDIKGDFAVLARTPDMYNHKKVMGVLRIVYGINSLTLTVEQQYVTSSNAQCTQTTTDWRTVLVPPKTARNHGVC